MNVRFKSCFLKSWYRDLNSGPLPYQGSALPLSYNSRLRAENGAQTRDPQLGRLVLYQLSYFRLLLCIGFRQKTYWHLFVGADGFEPPKSKDSRFTVCPIWPLWKTPVPFVLSLLSDSNQRPRDYKSRALAN